jgi:hypothetical protein
MKLLRKAKDGGPDSTVTGYWLIEWKRLFSIVLLRFDNGSRDAYHDHAFNAVSWVLSGTLIEYVSRLQSLADIRLYRPSIRPVLTSRETMHKVVSRGTTWVLSFRGPWRDTWNEVTPEGTRSLTHGRRVI